MKRLARKNLNELDMRSRVILSTASQVLGQVVGIGFAIATLKIITNSLGVSGYGIYATALAFVTSFALFTDFGLTAITGREIAKSPEKADEIISYNMGLKILLCVLALPLIIGLSYVFYPHGGHALKVSIALLSAYLVFDAMRAVSLAYFTSKVRNDVSAVVGAVQQSTLLVLSIVVALFSHSVYGFVIAFGLANVTSAVVSIMLARKHVTVRPRANLAYWRKNMAMSISYGVILISNLLYLKADSILLSIIKSPTEVGIYGIAYSLVLAFLLLPSFVMTALIPSMATVKGSAELSSIIEKAFSYMAILAGLLAVGGFVVRDNIVVAVSSREFIAAATPFAILCLASAFSYLISVFSYASVSVDKHHKLVYVSIGTLLLNVALNIVLIPKYSINGSAWATVICEVLSLAFIYIIFSRQTKTRVRIFRMAYKPAASAILTVGIAYNVRSLWQTGSAAVNAVISGVTVMITFLILLGLMRGLPEEVNQASAWLKARRRGN